jgi:dethiobiotin synthetase
MQLKQASQSDEPLAQICRYQFEPAISPARAIQQSQCMISIQDLVQASEVNAGDFALVEGAGGFYSPLASDGLNADLAQQLNYPIILVVGNRLGCLNHALLTIEAIERRGLQLHRIVLNDLCKEADPDNLNDLKQLTDYPVVHQAFQAEISPLNL